MRRGDDRWSKAKAEWWPKSYRNVRCRKTRIGGTEPNNPIAGCPLVRSADAPAAISDVTPVNVPRSTLRLRAKIVPPRRYGFDIDLLFTKSIY